jgi:mannosyl-3-phosphoglycerate phosphatase family protein
MSLDKPNRYLIFTDMDGTLLDHYTYTCDPARPLLKSLERDAIPVIPISSKTKEELAFLRLDIENNHPFITENGAAIYIPVGYFPTQPEDTVSKQSYWIKEFVQDRHTWQQIIDECSTQFNDSFKTFDQIGVEGIIEMTQLDHDSALRASQRHYGEPVVWYGTDYQKQIFIDALTSKGAYVLQGGRFMHVSGKCDKGLALDWLKKLYQSYDSTSNYIAIAAGDSHNDIAMLEQADKAIIIRSPVHAPPQLSKQDGIYLTNDMGPEGWVEGITHIFSIINESKQTH